MGKQHRQTEQGATAIASPPKPKSSPKRWRVSLSAGTPLAFPQMEIDAASETEAKLKFCEANGISSSECPWTIEPIE